MDALLQVIEADGNHRDETGADERDSSQRGQTHQVASGFARTAFCHSTSFVAFGGRTYWATWLGSTRL